MARRHRAFTMNRTHNLKMLNKIPALDLENGGPDPRGQTKQPSNGRSIYKRETINKKNNSGKGTRKYRKKRIKRKKSKRKSRKRRRRNRTRRR